MAAMEQHIRLAQNLHPRLLRFFTRFPPPQLVARSRTSSSQQSTVSTSSTTSPFDPNTSPETHHALPKSSSLTWPDNSGRKKLNPFLPWKNPKTGNWHGAHYSLRRQAELFRLARENHVLPLMPLSPKHPEVKEAKAIERGLQQHRRMQEGLLPLSGKRAKGKLWERTLRGRMEERRKAMEGMPEMIRQWKEKGHGRGWKKWPR